MSLTPGARLGPYEILAPLGAGGMGQVFRAKDTRLNRTVAIKVLMPRLAAAPEFQRRFQIEARAVSRLSHPHTRTPLAVGRHEGTEFLAIDYLQEPPHAERQKKGLLPPESVALYAM